MEWVKYELESISNDFLNERIELVEGYPSRIKNAHWFINDTLVLVEEKLIMGATIQLESSYEKGEFISTNSELKLAFDTSARMIYQLDEDQKEYILIEQD